MQWGRDTYIQTSSYDYVRNAGVAQDVKHATSDQRNPVLAFVKGFRKLVAQHRYEGLHDSKLLKSHQTCKVSVPWALNSTIAYKVPQIFLWFNSYIYLLVCYAVI